MWWVMSNNVCVWDVTILDVLGRSSGTESRQSSSPALLILLPGLVLLGSQGMFIGRCLLGGLLAS